MIPLYHNLRTVATENEKCFYQWPKRAGSALIAVRKQRPFFGTLLVL